MRDLYTVINQLLREIPSDESNLRDLLKGIQSKLMYVAPESQRYFWNLTSTVLEQNTLDKTDHWVKITQSIFNDNPALLYVPIPS